MAQHVVVTGGAGYLGSILCEHLLAAGYRVTVLDNLLYAQQTHFHFCANPNYDFVFGDVRDSGTLKKVISDADVIIPLAAIVGAPACDRDPLMAQSVNFDAIKLLNKLRSPSQLVIYPNTNSGYGTKSGEVFCTEDSPLDPISLYGRSKVEAEFELLSTPNAVALRLATVFGSSPRMRLDLLVNTFVYAACTDRYVVIFEKDFKRNFVHVRDVADCFLYCIENGGRMAGQPYNLGLDAANMSKEELALKIKAVIPDFYIHFSQIGSDPDKRNYIVSSQRLREAGFEAKRSIEDGIKELIKSFRMLKRLPFKNV
jgi:nucleoside-diphosphate-sugar epimerase